MLNVIKNPEDDYQPEAVAKDAVQKAQHVMPEPKHGVRRLTAAISRPQCSELTPDEVGLLVTDEIGEDHFFENQGDPIAGVFERPARNICAHCTKRIFNECKALPRAEKAEEALGGVALKR